MDQLAQSSYGAGINVYDVNVRTINDNKMWVINSNNRSRTSCEAPPRRERCVKVTNKSENTWWWNDPERKRKRRVAKYKLYAAEGNLKNSIKKGLRWFKIKCIEIVTNL